MSHHRQTSDTGLHHNEGMAHKPHKMCRFVRGFFNLAKTFNLGVEPRMDLGHTEPSIRLSPAGLVNLLFPHPVQTRRVRHTDHIHRFFTVVFGSSSAQTPNPTPEEKRFRVSVLSRCFLPTTEPAPVIQERLLSLVRHGIHKIFCRRICRLKKQAVTGFCSIK